MVMLAHILGVPVEEYVLPWIGGSAGMFIVVASSIRTFTHKRQVK
ncbi:MAG TPA: hypothetical protein VFL13_10070 [Candidatus Baltobacteraceae bacterium]|nr:hypothetical protein [Candidatus Baltobacteraceae bacterium]